MIKKIAVVCMLLAGSGAYTQHRIHGKVEDAKTKTALAGATVTRLSDRLTTVTDGDGYFSIVQSNEKAVTLEIRFVGYETQQVTVKPGEEELLIALAEATLLTDEVIIVATRAGEKTPTTFTTVSKEELQQQNFGQDLPLLLNWTPSLVTTSDAGNGIGYTGMRIRGSDATRINVTINGIPYNDSESQGTFWVDIPDIASSTQSIQIQRGVGTSSNGAGAFGATVNLQTNTLKAEPYAEAIVSAGSFNTQRYTFQSGTGLLNNRWAFDARLSRITSDGYVERASSDLGSYFLSAGYHGKNTLVKALVFGGNEVTYQSWYGLDEATMKLNRRFNYAGAIYDENYNVVRYYENQVDDYTQHHYQLHVSQKLNPYWNANMALHYTRGFGFYEEYHQGDSLKYLGLPDYTVGDTTISAMDVVVQRWLDNHFYGTTFSFNYEKDRTNLIIGGALNQYGHARHFGKLLWAQFADAVPSTNYTYYNGSSLKNDFNGYIKLHYDITNRVNGFIDLQYRHVFYKTAGLRDDQSSYAVNETFNFFNPKAGISYTLADQSMLYASYAIAHREPNRTDYLENDNKPKPERLGNLEAGWRKRLTRYTLEINYYLMNYKDQLVLTGELDNAGYPIRANVGSSYRTGIEVSSVIRLNQALTWNVNTTLSKNMNRNYTFTNSNNDLITRNTPIILSPNFVAGSQLSWQINRIVTASLLSKYVGGQFLDNTGNESLKLDAYFVNDLRLNFRTPFKTFGMEVNLLVNNVLNVEYAANGYAYYGTAYFYPQAGRHFMAMLHIKF
ncbi:MAG: TonB-dependent receptor [Flammeovirgaceae bacterium]|nr:MAG: TonB-dependent receptor [Flammeovirgaceae bacterium]